MFSYSVLLLPEFMTWIIHDPEVCHESSAHPWENDPVSRSGAPLSRILNRATWAKTRPLLSPCWHSINALQFITIHYNIIQFITIYYSSLLCITIHDNSLAYNSLRIITIHYKIIHYKLIFHYNSLRFIAIHYNFLYFIQAIVIRWRARRTSKVVETSSEYDKEYDKWIC